MTAPAKKNGNYQYQLKGPDTREGFVVTSGVVVIHVTSDSGKNSSIIIPKNGIWPGEYSMPETLATEATVETTSILPGTKWEAIHPTPQQLAFGCAMVVSQVLAHGTAEQRIARATRWYGRRFRRSNHATCGLLMSMTRETYTKMVSTMPQAESDTGDLVLP